MGVNLPRVVTQRRPAVDQTRDLLIASPTPYYRATTPPSTVATCYDMVMVWYGKCRFI